MIGPEADEAAFVDRLGRRLAVLALGLEREVDLHDRVLLHDPDQHDQADERVDVQLVAEEPQRDRARQGRPTAGPRESSAGGCSSRTACRARCRRRRWRRRAAGRGCCIDCWKTLADPWKLVVTVGRQQPVRDLLDVRRWPCRATTPGFRPNEIDTAGSWPEWLIVCGPTVSLNLTTDSSGTSVPLGALNAILRSESACSWYFGSSSSSTRYCALAP